MSGLPGDPRSAARGLIAIFKTESKWPDPEASTGMHLQIMGRQHCWEAVGPARAAFIVLAEEIKEYLEKCSDSVSCEVTWSLYMTGRAKETSCPTVVFCSSKCEARRAVRKTIKSSGILKSHPGFITMDCNRPPGFRNLVPLTRYNANSEYKTTLHSPSNNAIGAKLSISKSGLTPSAVALATAGGILEWRNRLFIMTVAHVFLGDQQWPFAHEETSDDFEFDIDSTYDFDEDEDLSANTTSRASMTSEDSDPESTISSAQSAYSADTPSAGLVSRPSALLSQLQDGSSTPCPPEEGLIDGNRAGEVKRQVPVHSVPAALATTELHSILSKLGLTQYIDRFVDEGFDTWEIMLDITESDLDALGIKTEHRRILQQEIACFRGVPIELVISPSRQGVSKEGFDNRYQADVKSNPGTGQKRKYRRHAKPYEYVYGRPASAHDIFSNKIREQLKPEDLSFTDIAEEVEKRWHNLPEVEKDLYKFEASSANEKYASEMADYKTIESYRGYQQYLVDFETKQCREDLALQPPLTLSTDGSRSSLDYALIEVDASEPMIANASRVIERFTTNKVYTKHDTHGTLPLRTVVADTASGRKKGQLIGTPTFMQLPKSTSQQELWTVCFDNRELQRGDCGSWVVDATNGDVYGHVIAGCIDAGFAYIIPLWQILEDVQDRFAGSWIVYHNVLADINEPYNEANSGLMNDLIGDDDERQGRRKRSRLQNNASSPKKGRLDNALTCPEPNSSAQAQHTSSLPQSGDGGGRDSTRSPTTKAHKCPYCSIEFTRHHNLKSHLLTHSDEKPYSCDTCKARLRHLHDLKRHTEIHRVGNPNICPRCDRTFHRRDALARHTKGKWDCAGRSSSLDNFEDVENYDGGMKFGDSMSESLYTSEEAPSIFSAYSSEATKSSCSSVETPSYSAPI